jgi:hypothetical protein
MSRYLCDLVSHSNFSSNHKFGAIFASRVGDAKLPVCGLDLKELAKTPDPAIRHIRNSLLS